ncbi:TIGR01777 family oxidoreductase [Saccharopolyspora taberi]|uniref:TIGR01777 family oxidoreductase n=1 Tax=Saccharopolyspora taberi TaxID=60895 RepID=A0ABN3V9Y6_9PSEU
MGLVHSSVFEAPIDEVFTWHTRPGAIIRLTPPWGPARVVTESVSLRDGRAVLALPGGLKWTARHDPDAYDPPYRFADEVDGRFRWRHTHEFTAEGGDRTRLTDTVDTPVPERFLRPVFTYRHRQLADDLAVHRWARQLRPEPLTVAVTGSSGLVGSALTALLTSGGHRVVRLVRRSPRTAGERRWRPEAPDPDLLEGVDAVVHLAGASIAGRFTPAHKHEIRASRVGPTRALAELAARGAIGAFVSASAIGFYGPDRGDEPLTERSSRGSGFLADVVVDWEAASAPAEDAGVRTVRVRTGEVQSAAGGMLRMLRPLFAAGLGGRLGSGEQWTSWIALDDLLDVYYRALVDTGLSGPVNAVAPHPLRNIDYSRTLAEVLRRPAVVPTPSFGPRLLLGAEGARELAEADQRVVPQRLLDLSHRFRFRGLEPALRHALGRTG